MLTARRVWRTEVLACPAAEFFERGPQRLPAGSEAVADAQRRSAEELTDDDSSMLRTAPWRYSVFLATTVLAILLALTYLTTGALKLLEAKPAVQVGEHLGVPHGLGRGIGVLEVSAGAGLLAGLALWPLGVAASVGVVLLMTGAVVFHVRAGDKAAQIAPPVALGILAIAEAILRAASS